MGKTIMIVDDSTSMRRMLSFTLESAGYKVIEAEDGLDALGKAKRQMDMLIVDVNMPHLNGFELTRSVRAMSEHRFTPIIMLTTESVKEKKAAGQAAGATGWITKPFKPQQLIGVVQKVMSN